MTPHISYSELTSLNRCEKLWEYGYLRGYEPLRKDDKLSRGTIMHALLAEVNQGVSWEDAWTTYRTKALEDAVLAEEVEALVQEFDVYFAVMERYVAWEATLSPITPVSVEQSFLIDLPVGGTLKIKPDLIYEDTERGLVLRDYKTADDFDKDMELRTDFDPQLSVYAWGLRRLGYDIRSLEHTFLRMRLPAVPKINKDGTMSKVYVITDEATVRQFVQDSGVKISDADLETYIAKLPQDAFFRQITSVRTNEELEAIAQEIMLKTLRRNRLLEEDDTPTRTLIPECVRCAFFGPCIVSLKGGSEDVLLAEKYRKREESEEAPMPVDFEEVTHAPTDA